MTTRKPTAELTVQPAHTAVGPDTPEPIVTAGRAAGTTAEIVETGLLALAVCANAQEASDRLAALEPPIKVRKETLLRWRRVVYPTRYRLALERHQATIENAVVASVRELALSSSQAAQAAVDLERERIASGDVKDAGASARNMATVAGIATDKYLLLQGRPTQITESRSADDVLAALERKGYVDSDAVEEQADGEHVGASAPQGGESDVRHTNGAPQAPLDASDDGTPQPGVPEAQAAPERA